MRRLTSSKWERRVAVAQGPWRRVGLRLLLAAALVVGGTGLVLIPTSPAAAACRDVGCNGLNPNTHCSATSTPRNWQVSSSLIVQLRRSSGCQAFWGRATQDCYGLPPLYVRVQRQLNTYYGYYTANVFYSGQIPCGGNPGWTPMVADYGDDRARSCYAFSTDGRSPSAIPESWWDCVGWVY